jgi:hypothetical protein
VPAGHRYDAACAAALAGCGQGKGLLSAKLDDKERARWRRQAREWLRQDLLWWKKALAKGDTKSDAEVGRRLRHWQTDGDLAGLREPSALAAMAQDERNECLALWEEVAAVLRRVPKTR